MRHPALLIACLLLCVCFMASAQTYTGTYTLKTETGVESLNLRENANGNVEGQLESGGLTFNLQGVVNNGILRGAVSAEYVEFYLEASLDGDALSVALAQFDNDNNPDYSSFQKFLFTRQDESAALKSPVGQRAQAPTLAPTEPANVATQPSMMPSSQPQIQSGGSTVSEPSWGISFTSPQGWTAQKTEGLIVLGSQTRKGTILIFPHQHNSVDELYAAAREGVFDENGTQLVINGAPQPFGKNGAAADYSGMVEWQQAKAHAVGVLSPYGGGITIIAAVEAASYTNEYADFVEAIAKSMKFSKPKTAPVAQQWQQKLRGSRLTYMSSYSSSGYGDSYGGYSDKTVIQLCSDGNFLYYGSSLISADAGGVGGYSSSRGGGDGTWKVTAQMAQVVLELAFSDGTVQQYTITYPENKFHLNGNRFFLTYDPDC